MKKSILTWATTLAVVGAMALPVMAGGGGGGGGGGGRGARGGAAGGAAGGAGGGAGGFGGGAGGGAAGGAGGGRQGGQAMDPAAQIQARLTNLRTALNITADDEWNVLAAKIQKVLEAQQKLAAGTPAQGGRGGGRQGGGAAPAVDQANPLSVAINDLRTSVAAGTTTDDNSLKTKLKSFRDARTTAQKAVTDAQADLQKVVTVRQEAILVVNGVLE